MNCRNVFDLKKVESRLMLESILIFLRNYFQLLNREKDMEMNYYKVQVDI